MFPLFRLLNIQLKVLFEQNKLKKLLILPGMLLADNFLSLLHFYFSIVPSIL